MEQGSARLKTRRHVELQSVPERLELLLPRFGLCLLLGVAVYALCAAVMFLPLRPGSWSKLLPWGGLLLAWLVFLGAYRLLRARWVLDRRGNAVLRNGRRLCALSEVVALEFDDLRHYYVMNEVALLLPGGRRLSLLLFDYPVDDALREVVGRIAAFARVPVRRPEPRVRWRR